MPQSYRSRTEVRGSRGRYERSLRVLNGDVPILRSQLYRKPIQPRKWIQLRMGGLKEVGFALPQGVLEEAQERARERIRIENKRFSNPVTSLC